MLVIEPTTFLLTATILAIASSFSALASRRVALTVALIAEVIPLLLCAAASDGVIMRVLVLDSLTRYIALVVFTVAILTTVLTYVHLTEFEHTSVVLGLIPVSTLGMLLMAMSVDLIALLVGWELMSLPCYALLSIYPARKRAVEAAVKYFVLDVAETAIFVTSLALFYGLSGGASKFEEIARSITASPYSVLAFVLLITAFSIKLCVIPFHMWLPDVADGANPAVSALLIAAAKAAAYAALVRILWVMLAPLAQTVFIVLACLAAITMTLGNIMALDSRNIFRLIAYSSIAHSGYIICGLAVLRLNALTAALFHILTVAVSDVLAFASLAALIDSGVARELDKLSGFGRASPLVGVSLSLSLLSLLGLPILAAFWSKLMLFLGVVERSRELAVVFAVNCGISVGYYIRAFKAVWWGAPPSVRDVSARYAPSLAMCMVVLLLVSVTPFVFVPLAQAAAISVALA